MQRSQRIFYLLFVVFLATQFTMKANADTKVPATIATQQNLKYWLLTDNFLPIISVKMIFENAGSAYDPKGKYGVANMVSEMLTEGAAGIKAEEYVRQLEEMASSINFSVDEDNFYVELTSLAGNFEKTVELLSLAMMRADFNADAMARVKKSILTEIIKQNEDPGNIALRAFRESYFKNHPYSRDVLGLPQDIKNLKQADLKKYIIDNFTKTNVVIGVSGAIEAVDASRTLDKYLGGLKLNGQPQKPLENFEPNFTNDKIVTINHDVPQSVIIFGFPSPYRTDADFYPAYLLNHIFGGGEFESHLMQELREKRGLVYSAYSTIQNYKHAGIFMGQIATKNETKNESIAIIKDEITKIANKSDKNNWQPADDAEIQKAKDYLIGSFPLRMTRNSNLASFLTAMQYDNLGIDFLQKRNSYVANVTSQQLQETAKKYLNTQKTLFVVVGKE